PASLAQQQSVSETDGKTVESTAPQRQPPALRLDRAIDRALANYPSVKVALAKEGAAREGIALSRTAYLPRFDFLLQENRASRNNFFGLLLPQSIVPSVAGPVLGTRAPDSVWDSAGGLLASWEPFDFGLRRANVSIAEAQDRQADAEEKVTRLGVAVTAADAFLAYLATKRTVIAADANVQRMRTFAKTVHVLVDNQLRAGADASRADAEVAAAEIQLIQAQQASEVARANLAEAIGSPGSAVDIDPGPLLKDIPDPLIPAEALQSHPLALVQQAAVDTVLARERVLERSYVPKFYLQTSLSERGSGALLNGGIDNSKGFLPDVPNWAVGITVTFPAFDIFSIRSRKRIEANNEAAERAVYEQTLQKLQANNDRSRVITEAARRIAAQSPVAVQGALEAETRARARYDAKLATVNEVADAERLLAQAEVDDVVARLGVWRALLAAASASGDIRPFLNEFLRRQ
ncbi:MAG TPA: TolC family protein, partial [Blastocatellia bacterium]|nr:TolC family protein [Blastocatellia bacterium]